MTSNNTEIIHFLIIGFGNIAQRHMNNILAKSSNQFVTILTNTGYKSQINDERVSFFSDQNEIINFDFDYIFICSPATFHIQHLEFSIKTKCKRIFIEKPLASDLEILDFCDKLKKKDKERVFIGYCLRYNKSLIALKKAIDTNVCGNIISIYSSCGQYLPNWRPGKDYKKSVSAQNFLGGGALLELSHEFDYIQWIFEKLEIKCSMIKNTGALDIDVEDLVDIFAETIHGASVKIHLNFLERTPQRFCYVLGNKGSLRWDFSEGTVIFSDGYIKEYLHQGNENDINQMYIDMLDDFLGEKKYTPSINATVETSLNVLQLIQDIRKSEI